jgi:hypothetical protein
MEEKKINNVLMVGLAMTCLIAILEGRSITTLFCVSLWIYLFIFINSKKKDL